ncbi:unnamed protein product [Thelazia callipaeda]|uniref:non-specific serine/threonine protein kinase n=1 Tax=Thelazia callipaeda TaxID=103827 RepID=A0A0N5D4M3_THECL|nr:unnamed protein product [Thelazia callipaeda]
MKLDQKVRNRWLIKVIFSSHINKCKFVEDIQVFKGIIGSGGYGEIYYALDLKMNNESVAVKVEPAIRKGKVAKRMILEQKLLLRLQGQPHAPLMWGSGTEHGLNYIVMQLLSTNVADLKKQCPVHRLSRPTAGRIMQQVISGLRGIHKVGYIHRDVKPANMCFGLTEKSYRRLIIVDYGLARRFRLANGKPIERRVRAGFRGTLRYVSIRVHDRQEQGPSDDLVALFFTLIEIVQGELPWRYEKSDRKMKIAKMELVGRVKRRLITSECTKPDQKLNLAHNRPLNDPYDWENDYLEVMQE